MIKIPHICPVRDATNHASRGANSTPPPGARPASANRFLLSALALSAPFLVSVAMAADMPMKAAAAAPVFTWTGCYVGINAGGGASGSDFVSRVDPGTHLIDPADLAAVGAYATGSANDIGFIGGGQVGCNFQSGAFVFGAEGDWDYFGSRSRFRNPNGVLTTGDTFTVTQSLKTSSLATLRPRLGMVTDRTLLYITGGAAFAKVNYAQSYADTLNTATGGVAGSATLVGWTVGAGWEWAWTDHVTVKTEYLFAKLPTTNALGGILDTAGGNNALHGSSELTIQIARLGLNYRF